MKIKVTKDLCEIKENEIWNVGDYNVHTVQVELSPEFNGLVNKVRYFVEDNSYDMLITDNVAQVPYEATVMEGTIKIGVYGYDADTDILVQSTSPVNKYISSGTYTGEANNTQPLTPTDKQQMETAIQKNTNDITDLKANKQDKLISGVNIKTINNESILSGGNLTLIEEEADPIFTNSPAYSITDNDITYWNNKANMSDIPDVSNFITKDVDNLTYYTKSTDMQTAINNAVGDERTARENADNSLQNQIDAITVSSDVVDVVSTYQDLIDYDTQHIKVNDIIKVMQDSTHDNAISYYRWVIVNHVGSWVYVGSEGPYYTKSETDTLLNAKQNTLISGQNIKTINSESLLGEGNIIIQGGGTSDYTDLTNKPKINNVELSGNKSLNDLGIQPEGNYALESEMTEAQNDIEALQTENERLKATLPTTTGEGENVTLDKTAEMEFIKPPLPRGNSEQESTTGKNLLKPEGAPTTIRGVSWSYREDGAVVGERVSSNANVSDFTLTASSTFQPGSYIYSCFDSESTPGASKYQSNISINGGTYWGTGNYSFVLNEPSTIRVVLRVYPNFTGTAIFKPMIRLSSIQESNFEPYTGGIPSPNPDYPQEVEVVTGNVEVTISNENNTESKTLPVSLGNIELCKIGNYQDVFIKENNDWKIPNKTIKIDNYNGETITTPYISTTGGLDIGATVYYVGTNDLLITDATLISQLEEISKTLSYQGQTNITSNTIALFDVEAYQDISGKANKISVVQTSASTIEINSNTFYKFGEVASLTITLASITDNTIYNEYMFEFVSGTTATTLTLPSSIKWLETPTIDANKIYQCSIVDNIGILVGVANV